jgi:hypothetical protein
MADVSGLEYWRRDLSELRAQMPLRWVAVL